jgi:hypothetical protein
MEKHPVVVHGGMQGSEEAALVVHIHRAVIHHGAEVALLRDLYAHRTDDRKAR